MLSSASAPSRIESAREPGPDLDVHRAGRASPAQPVAARGSRPSPRVAPADWAEAQPTPSSALPDPQPLLENLARCVIEIIAGARELEQISRWVDDAVYRHLLKRVVLSSRARQARGERGTRPVFRIGGVQISRPRDGVVEAVVVVHGRARSRAVAMRLEGLDGRWRATAIHVL